MSLTSVRVGAHSPAKIFARTPFRARFVVPRIICQADNGRSIPTKSLNAWVAAATAALLVAAPVDAKIVLVQPKLKSVFYDTAQEKKEKPSRKQNTSPSMGGGGFGLDLGTLSLPLTIIGCAGLYVAGSRFGNRFDTFMDAAWVKDSNTNGIGYEEEYKATDFSKPGKR